MIDEAIRVAFADILAPIVVELRAQREEIRRLREALGAGRWVDRRVAAQVLGVSICTIDRRLADGSLRGRRLGRSVRVLLEQAASTDEIGQLAAEARS